MDEVLDVNALRASFAVAVQDPNLMMRFYLRLFARHPVLRPLFMGRAMPVANETALRSIIELFDQLDEPRILRKNLRALGVRHMTYGVTEEMYPWVGACLLETLAESLGPSWTPRIEAAWQEAYDVMSATMIEGAELTSVPTLRAAS